MKRKTKSAPPKRAPFKQRLQKQLLDDAAHLRDAGMPDDALLPEWWARELDHDDDTLAKLHTVADALHAGMRIGYRLIRAEQTKVDAIVEPYRRKVRAQTLGSVKGAQAAAKSKKDTADSELTTAWMEFKAAERKANGSATRKHLISKFRKVLGRRRKERFDALLKEGRIS